MDNSIQTITKNAQETSEFGKKIGNSLRPIDKGGAVVYCLFGELGSGKTTFIQGFARGLGITSRLLSPTFIIVRRYSLQQKFIYFYHIDLYRITSRNELEGLGLAEILSDPKSIVAIEWAEKLGKMLPNERTDIHFDTMEDGRHKINIKKLT